MNMIVTFNMKLDNQNVFSNFHSFPSNSFYFFSAISVSLGHFQTSNSYFKAFTAITNHFLSFLDQSIKFRNTVNQVFESIYFDHWLGFRAHFDVLWDASTSLKPKPHSGLTLWLPGAAEPKQVEIIKQATALGRFQSQRTSNRIIALVQSYSGRGLQ